MAKSSKYLVHLNTFLCEGSMHVVNKSRLKFLTYSSFCRHYAILIEKQGLTEHELSILNQIYQYVNPYLALSKEQFMKHIYEYFKLSPEDLMTYQKIVAYRKKFSIE